MNWLRIALLLSVAVMTSGYRFRCYWLCTDQTGVQSDYIEQRDRCREYAQLKIDMAMKAAPGQQADDKSRKAQLISLFSDCMGNNGWSVPDGRPAGAAAAAPPPQKTEVAQDPYPTKAALTRSTECSFARHAAAHSSIAAARAAACDLECAQRLKAAPESPRPAACPADVDPNSELIKGYERN